MDCPPGCTFNNYCGRACRQRASGISPRTATPSFPCQRRLCKQHGYRAARHRRVSRAWLRQNCPHIPKYSDLPRRLIMQRRDALRSISVAGGVAAASRPNCSVSRATSARVSCQDCSSDASRSAVGFARRRFAISPPPHMWCEPSRQHTIPEQTTQYLRGVAHGKRIVGRPAVESTVA